MRKNESESQSLNFTKFRIQNVIHFPMREDEVEIKLDSSDSEQGGFQQVEVTY